MPIGPMKTLNELAELGASIAGSADGGLALIAGVLILVGR